MLATFALLFECTRAVLHLSGTGLRAGKRQAHAAEWTQKVIRDEARGNGRSRKIPSQIVFTAKSSSMKDLPAELQRNVNRTLRLSPDLRVRWFGDRDCMEYIKKYYDDELSRIFASETLGMYRGDICRAAVLAKEGGFYSDVDLEMKVPVTSLVEDDTTFMSAFAGQGSIVLNAIMASVPGDAIMLESIEQMRQQYRSKRLDSFLGCRALRNAMEVVQTKECGNESLILHETPRWTCGSEVVRMFQERFYNCMPPDPGLNETSDCNAKRGMAMMHLDHGSLGIFIGSHLIGWPYTAECVLSDCNDGGHDRSEPALGP